MPERDHLAAVSHLSSWRRCRLLLLCALLCALTAWPAQPAWAGSPQAQAPRIDAGLDPALAAALDQILEQVVAGKSPGAALAVFVPGRGVWVGARGLADRDGGIPLAPDTLFGVGS